MYNSCGNHLNSLFKCTYLNFFNMQEMDMNELESKTGFVKCKPGEYYNHNHSKHFHHLVGLS